MKWAILIIDDEQNVRRSLQRELQSSEYEFFLASNGEEALRVMSQRKIAVIICDQRMPGLSGAQVLAESVQLCPDAYRITLTGYTDLAGAQASINEGGVNYFMTKPWDSHLLREVVRNGARTYQTLFEKRRLEELAARQKAELEKLNQHLEREVRNRTAELENKNASLQTLQRRLEQSLSDTVATWANMLEVCDPNLGIHCKRVSVMARALGQALSLSGQALLDAEFAAHLHDIGRIVKFHGLLYGDAGRTEDIQHYSDHGYTLLSHVRGFEDIATAIKHQHECYDGSGYPDGLAGDKIPLYSQIIAVANAFDRAVYSIAHPSRVSVKDGIRELLRGKGTLFSPELATLLIDQQTAATGCMEVELSTQQVTAGMVLARPIKNIDGELMLNAGVELSPELVERVESLGRIDPLLARVFVKANPDHDDAVPETGEHDIVEPVEEINDANSEKVTVESVRPSVESVIESVESSIERPAELPNEHESSDTSAPVKDTLSHSHTPVQPQDRPESPPLEVKPLMHEQPIKVLVVDDSPLVCKALLREFRRAGFDGITTDNAPDALRLISKHRFDVALVDLAMPIVSGMQLVKQLKSYAPRLPCIIITGNVTKDEVIALSSAPNVTGILAKPWDHERLIKTIMAAVIRGRQERVENLA